MMEEEEEVNAVRDALSAKVIALVDKCAKLGDLSAHQIASNLLVDDETIKGSIKALEELACALETEEEKYLMGEERSPLINEREVMDVGVVLKAIMEEDRWPKILTELLSQSNNILKRTLWVQNAVLHLLCAFLESTGYDQYLYTVFDVEACVPYQVILGYAYGDAYFVEKQQQNDLLKKGNTTPTIIRRRNQQQNRVDDEIAQQVMKWWRDDPEQAKVLRSRATAVLSSLIAGDKRVAEYVMEPHVEKAIPIPFPRILLARLRKELIPEYQKAVGKTRKRTKKKKEEVSDKQFKFCNQYNQEIRFVCRILGALASSGNYGVLRPVMQDNGVKILLQLLQFGRSDVTLALETLELLAHLINYKTFADEFLNLGGISTIYDLAKTTSRPAYLYAAISWCFAEIAGTVQEKLCTLPTQFIRRLNTFMLSLVKHDQDVTRQSAMQYFAEALKFPMNLRMFHSMDGVRKLLDVLADPSSVRRAVKVEHVVLNTIQTLNVYFKSHVAIATWVLKRELAAKPPASRVRRRDSTGSQSSLGSSASHSTVGARNKTLPEDKPLEIDDVAHNNDMSFLLAHREAAMAILSKNKQIVDNLLVYKFEPEPSADEEEPQIIAGAGLQLLHQIILQASSMEVPRSYCTDAGVGALQILRMVTLLPYTYQAVCESNVSIHTSPLMGDRIGEHPEDEEQVLGITVLLDAAVGTESRDARLIVGALEVLCNCCTPLCGEDRAQRPVRRLARHNNALMTLLSLLRYNETPRYADNIRYLACLVLNGLANDRQVTQVLETLNVTQALTKIARSEPVVVENKRIHKKLKKEALKLISHISGVVGVEGKNIIGDVADETNKRLLRNSIVERTQISFDSRELLGLIAEHLKDLGLNLSARTLQKEAKTVFPVRRDNKEQAVFQWPTRYCSAPAAKRFAFYKKRKQVHLANRKVGKMKRRLSPQFDSDAPNNKRQKLDGPVRAPSALRVVHSSTGPSTGLERIVQNYLREQHRKCLDPVTIIPPMTLVGKHHRCTGDKVKKADDVNVLSRLWKRQIYGHVVDTAQDVRLIYGRTSRWVKSFKNITKNDDNNDDDVESQESDDVYTSVAFLTKHNGYEDLLFGTSNGELVLRNVHSTHAFAKWQVHEKTIGSIRLNPQQTHVLTCASDVGSVVLSRFPESITARSDGDEERCYYYHQHNKTRQEDMLMPLWQLDNIADVEMDCFGELFVGTLLNPEHDDNEHAAVVYDLLSSREKCKLTDSKLSSRYWWHRACFSPDGNTTILHDGLLWDTRAPKVVHKFDKLSECGRATFKPDGTQVVIDSAVWDMRNFKLFTTCTAFEGAVVEFDTTSSVAYSYYPRLGPDELKEKPFASFCVTDVSDYSNITTCEFARPNTIQGLTLDPTGQRLGVIIQRAEMDSWETLRTTCRLFEVGRVDKGDEDGDFSKGPAEDDDETSTSNDDQDSSSSDGDSSGDGDDVEEEFFGSSDDDEEIERFPFYDAFA
mmetsp:Transcript_28609/g.46142  ORF Transcript_28609/g.46142 Transcript_28609/m.46142 type:complete len:1478 (+) Transcript_28609:539-4972(+)|eukprot:CAMPEP_0203753894 /NCGR_PEP_ID=MMETSP0098-20131031/7591_1 /ASSEMBLY_ACC=CAM_ASM_000208 /TAXON_ID=96639 /ORGANISM=" , Strain NY0313808BC1" /LENGTH=1477 /DNA_ID=CAMNT_0050644701 /DNA_START=503 /DNA_END=4936 /DNA_ORIENTATION=-